MPYLTNQTDSSSDSDDISHSLSAHRGETVVIKYGGNAMTNQKVMSAVADDIATLHHAGCTPVVVHGGGPAINAAMKQAGIKPEFIQGHRKTCEQSMKIVSRVLTGPVNSGVVDLLVKRRLKAMGINGRSGPDGNLIQARKHFREMEIDGKMTQVDLGYVGEVTGVDVEHLRDCMSDKTIPVMAPIGVGEDDHDYNINADVLAGAVAAALDADHLIYLTDIDGIRQDPGDADTRIQEMDASQARGMLGDVIQGGMIPKVESLLGALEDGLKQGHIVDGRCAGSLSAAIAHPNTSGTTLHG